MGLGVCLCPKVLIYLCVFCVKCLTSGTSAAVLLVSSVASSSCVSVMEDCPRLYLTNRRACCTSSARLENRSCSSNVPT